MHFQCDDRGHEVHQQQRTVGDRLEFASGEGKHQNQLYRAQNVGDRVAHCFFVLSVKAAENGFGMLNVEQLVERPNQKQNSKPNAQREQSPS